MGPVCLTAVFGMGTGVSTRVWSPGILENFRLRILDCRFANLHSKICNLKFKMAAVRVVFRVEPLSPRVVPGGKVNAVKRSAVSTGQLNALLHLHTPPIDLVIFQEPSQTSCRRPHLA